MNGVKPPVPDSLRSALLSPDVKMVLQDRLGDSATEAQSA